jgi:hypothetical protein
MGKKEALNQSIAVFGGSGSGKTVLLSSFYGELHERRNEPGGPAVVVADDLGQGNHLYQNYLKMRDSAELPAPNRFSSTLYKFSVKLEDGDDAMRLAWHDYPGEWFEQGVSGEEAERRVDTFRDLLGSDVAFLLVDGQRLLDNAGEEERYLKSLFANVSDGLLSLKKDLLAKGKLVTFPRIWILALSKADLLPEYSVSAFRDLIILKANDELEHLRKVLAGLVESPEALSVGEDFMLLSSAKFEANSIEVTKRIGLDLILPLAAMLPFERHLRWVHQKKARGALALKFFNSAGPLIATMIGKAGGLIGKLHAPAGKILGSLSPVIDAAILSAFERAEEKLQESYSKAGAKSDEMEELLHSYKLALEKGEADGVLLLSRR